jgi:hypothetical protein
LKVLSRLAEQGLREAAGVTVRSADISERQRVVLASLLVRLAGEPQERFPGSVHQARRKAFIRLKRIAGRKHDVSRTHHKLEI